MYFYQKKYFLLHKKEKINFLKLSETKQIKLFHDLFNDFRINFWNKLENEHKIYQFQKGTKKYHDLLLGFKFETKFRKFINQLNIITTTFKSENQYFKLTSQPLMHKTTWYGFKNKIIKLINKKINNGYFEWINHIGKLPIKNNITKKYNYQDYKFIINQYYEYIKNGFDFEITDFWLSIRNNKTNEKTTKICQKTIKKILHEELGIVFNQKKKYLRKHPKRHYIAKPGNIQMDLKIIGKKDTKCTKQIIVFDMIETRSRYAYSKVIDNASQQEIINALESGIQHFNDIGIKIKTIQTDNAMMFKGNNFISSESYINFLRNKNIIRRLIPLNVPQANGCVERLHLTIDKKCSTRLAKTKTIEEAKNIINEFMEEYNNCRYHYYSELEKIKGISYVERYMKPIDAIKLLYNYG